MAGSKKTTREVDAVIETKQPKLLAPLTGIQESICDQIADLLVNGGSQKNLARLVYTTLDHQWRKEAVHLDVASRGDQEAWIKGLVDRDFEDALDELAAARFAQRKAPEVDRIEPAAAGDRIRLRNIERCERLMEQFLIDAHPEEISLMVEVLQYWESSHLAFEHGYTEIVLASAFEAELGNNRHYIRVPERLVDHVEGYVDALLTNGNKKTPALPGRVN